MNLSHENLHNYYNSNFLLMYLHKFSISDLEDMLPWERDVYVTLLENYIQEQKSKSDKGL